MDAASMAAIRKGACTVTLAAVLSSVGCLSTGHVLPSRRPVICASDARVQGVWKSFRWSQLGPSWVTVSFGCDCVYRSRVRLLWAGVREDGYYRTAAGVIHFTRPKGETVWPYRISGPDLYLEESDQEVHRYRLARRDSTALRTCTEARRRQGDDAAGAKRGQLPPPDGR